MRVALDMGVRAAASILARVNRFFRIERLARAQAERSGLDPEGTLELGRAVRERRSKQEWARLMADMRELGSRRSTLPKSQLGNALGDLRRQEDSSSGFLGDKRIPIHNNDTERDLRHVVIGRKNWLVFGRTRGSEVACRLYSLVLSCKAFGADSEPYLEDALMRVATTPSSHIADADALGLAGHEECHHRGALPG